MIEELTAEEFYRLRDDRTNRQTVSRDYHHLRVRLVAGHSTVKSFTGQVQLLVTANMLARWCRHIEFGFPNDVLDQQLQILGYQTLHQRIGSEVKKADPFANFVFKEKPSEDTQYTLKIGSELTTEPVDFTIDSDGWNIRAGQGSQVFDLGQSQKNPVGPAFAACIGVADAFKVATRQPEANRVHNFTWSILDFLPLERTGSTHSPRPPIPLTLGNMQIVGVGSVGSAIIYLLAMLPLQGSIWLIDHDFVKIENLNRSPLFGVDHVHKRKVTVAAHYLEPLIPVQAFEGRYDEFIAHHGRKSGEVDLIFPVANEFAVRTYIENNFPPLQIYGTTTPDWGVNYHRHIPLKEDCSQCRFPQSSHQANFICSEAQVETDQGDQVDAALPFVSMAAAALTMADLVKINLPGYPFTPNFAFIDFKGNLEFLLTYQKPRHAACMCARRSIRIYERFIHSTRFSTFSSPAV